MVNMPLQSRGNKNGRGFRQDPRSKRRALRQVLLSGMIEPIAAGRHAVLRLEHLRKVKRIGKAAQRGEKFSREETVLAVERMMEEL